MREALKNVICPSCGGPPTDEDSYFDEQKLRMENARLKEELDHVSSLASKYLGRPVTQLPPVQPVSVSSLDLSVGGYSDPALNPSLDLDLLRRNCSSAFPYPYTPAVSELEKPLMVEMATGAVEEVLRLVRTDEPLWVKSGSDGRDRLQVDIYDRMFQRSGRHLRFPHTRTETSRDSAPVAMNATTLIDMFMDASKCAELFPTIVAKARTIEVLAAGMASSRSGSLVLMYEELQVLSPLVPTREFCFLRYCQQIESVVPSPDGKRSMMKLAQRMVNNFCANVGASSDHKWMNLSGSNDVGVRIALHQSSDAGQPSGGVLCAATSIWLPVSAERVFSLFKDERTRTQVPMQLLEMSTSISIALFLTLGMLLLSLTSGTFYQMATHFKRWRTSAMALIRGIASLFFVYAFFLSCIQLPRLGTLCCTDASGSVVVYAPIDLPAINIVMSGGDPSYVPLLPLGFAILPDGRSAGGQGASSSSIPMGGSSGSLVTVAYQIHTSSLPSAKLNMESVMTVNHLIGTTVQQIKVALNCADA
ncbi:hypothetical protein B296_00042861 [Ensete ventricosum]|uniref:START domain-containing protein n=1 Tax=Ensete ventricosum TaxID=4639 RepID=A0A426YKQ4_ENSVE|nr:hypothetical protein B296_00042861 [Ensete ventricosum]